MPSLNCDSDDQEDAGRESKVAAALKEWVNKLNKAVAEAKVDGQNKKIREKENNVSYTET